MDKDHLTKFTVLLTTVVIIVVALLMSYSLYTDPGIVPDNPYALPALPNSKLTAPVSAPEVAYKPIQKDNIVGKALRIRKSVREKRYEVLTVAMDDSVPGIHNAVKFGSYDPSAYDYFSEFSDARASVSQLVKENTFDFWFSQNDSVFITLDNGTPGDANVNIEKANVNLYTLDPRDYHLINSKTIYSGEIKGAAIYSIVSIIEYDAANKFILLRAGGGDSCWGSGNIYKLPIDTGVLQLVSKYSNGCAFDGPRFGGMMGDKLVFADAHQVTGNYSNKNFSSGYITNLYTIDPVNLSKSVVAYFKESDNFDMEMHQPFKDYNLSKTNVLLHDTSGMARAENVLYDVQNKTFARFKSLYEVVDEY